MDLAAAVQGGGNLVAWFVQAVLIVVGTIATLAYFHFGVRSNNELAAPRRYPIIEGLAQVGQIFIAITLGMLFAGVYAAAIAAFIDRISLLWNLISMMLPS
jgi:heme/copper-type cytochrome/quinol oxidase subunit 2